MFVDDKFCTLLYVARYKFWRLAILTMCVNDLLIIFSYTVIPYSNDQHSQKMSGHFTDFMYIYMCKISFLFAEIG